MTSYMNGYSVKNHIKKILGSNIVTFLKYNLPSLSAHSSYSQSGEDVLLDSFLGHKKNGFYVDIGAHDHISLSNSYLFYKRGWSGIQVEPNYKKISGFKKYRPGTTSLNVGIGDRKKSKFFIFDSAIISTFSEEEARVHESFGHKIVETVDVEVIPLQDIFKQYLKGNHIDFMSVDTEGYDMEVLKTNDWELYRPSFIIVETAAYDKDKYGAKLNDTYDPYMSGIGYEKVADTYLNTIYRDIKNPLKGW